MTIKIKLDIDQLRKIADPEQYYGLFGLSGSKLYEHEAYGLLLNFVEGDNGEVLTVDEARKKMKAEVTQEEMTQTVIPQFRKAALDALVNPTKGNS